MIVDICPTEPDDYPESQWMTVKTTDAPIMNQRRARGTPVQDDSDFSKVNFWDIVFSEESKDKIEVP